jgi:protein-serine/threonine kinase
MSNPKSSRSTPAPRHIREAPARPTNKPVATAVLQQKEPALPKVDMNHIKAMDKDVLVMMEKLKLQQKSMKENQVFVDELAKSNNENKSLKLSNENVTSRSTLAPFNNTTPVSPKPTTLSGSLPRKNASNVSSSMTKRHPETSNGSTSNNVVGSTRKATPSDRSTRFEREKEKLKEAAAALDRDKNLMKRTRDVEMGVSLIKDKTISPPVPSTIAIQAPPSSSSLLHPNDSIRRSSIIPNPQPQISTPVPSSNNNTSDKKLDTSASTTTTTTTTATAATTNKKQNQRISTMSDHQIMERLRSVVTSGDPNLIYKRTKRIGQGASGSVYLANHIKTNAKVAVKQMDLSKQSRLDLIVNEIMIMKESHHGNIVNFLDSFLVRGDLWVVMEYMEGGALTDVIEHNTMTEQQIATVCYEVCLFGFIK